MAAESSKRVAFPYEYLIVAALCLINFGPVTFCLSCAGIFYTPVAADIGTSPATLSYFLMAFSASMVIALGPLGKLFNKTDCRIVMTASIAIIAACLAGLSFVQADWQFLGLAFILGFGLTSCVYLAPPVLINRWFSKRAGFFIGIVMAFTGVGGVVWATAGGALIGAIGWRATYLVFAALTCAIGLPCTLLILRDRPSDVGRVPYGFEEGQQAAADYEQAGIPADQAQRMVSFKFLLAYSVVLSLGVYVYGMIPSYVATLPVSQDLPLLGAWASSCAMAASIVAKMMWGALGEKNLMASMLTMTAFAVAGIVTLLLAPSQWLIVCVAAASYGMFYGEQTVFCPIATRQLYGMSGYSQLYSKVSMLICVGVIAGSLIGGTIINATGGYTAMFLFIIASVVIACGFLFAARKTN